MKLIDKDALVAKIDERMKQIAIGIENIPLTGRERADATLEREIWGKARSLINSLEVKEVDLEREQRIKECPYRKVFCNRYEDNLIECEGRCSWVVDYPTLNRFKEQKGENV